MHPILKFIFNPFYKIAGSKALLWGLLILVLSGFLAYNANSRYDGYLDYHLFPKIDMQMIYVIDGIVVWLIGVVFFTILGKISSNTQFRVIDVLGTLALARAPYLLIPFLIFALDLHNFDFDQNALIEAVLNNQFDTALFPIASFTILAIGSILLVIWHIILLYKAYITSTNVKGNKAIISFIIGILLSEIVAFFIIRLY